MALGDNTDLMELNGGPSTPSQVTIESGVNFISGGQTKRDSSACDIWFKCQGLNVRKSQVMVLVGWLDLALVEKNDWMNFIARKN